MQKFWIIRTKTGKFIFNLQNKSYEEIYLQYLKRSRTTYSNPPRAGAELASFLMWK